MLDESHGPVLWTSIASAFRGDPAVMFDLFNEPENLPNCASSTSCSNETDGFEDFGDWVSLDQWQCWLQGC